ncbi:MAG: hypothetical protein V5A46_04110 [Haloferacaceae archaeon]
MGETNTLSFSLDSGTDRHYNISRIAYLDIKAESKQLLQYAVGGVLLVVAGIIAVSGSALAAAFPVALGAVAYLMLRGSDGVAIGTTTEEDHIQLRNVHELETEFEQLADDVIFIDGVTSGLLTRTDYRYYLVPSNVVSVERRHSSFGIDDLWPLSIAFLVPPAAGVILFDILGVSSVPGSVWLLFLLGAVFAVVVYYRYVREPSGVAIRLENGTRKIFTMTDSDARQLVEEFNAKV